VEKYNDADFGAGSARRTSSEQISGCLTPDPVLTGGDRLAADPALRKRLLLAYEQYVHPLLPMLNLQELALHIHDDGTATSLLSTTAMAAASVFIDVGTQLRGYLWDRARALMIAESEQSAIVLLQCMILMTYEESPMRFEHRWLTMAEQQAQVLLCSQWTDADDDEVLKRTVRCLLIRDTVLSLTERSRCQVHLEIPQRLVPLRRTESRESVDDKSDPREHEDEPCLALEKLCAIVRPMLDTAPGRSTFGQNDGELRSLLQYWAQRYALQARDADVLEVGNARIHWTAVIGLWSLAVLTFFCNSGDANPTSETTTLCTQDTRLVAMAISISTTVHHRLYEADLVRFLPSSSVSALIPATIAHLVNTTSEIQHICQESTQKFYCCWQVLHDLRKRYGLAAAAMSRIDSLGQQLRQKMDTTQAEQTKRLQEQTRSFCTANCGIQQTGVSTTSTNDEHWLALFAEPEQILNGETERWAGGEALSLLSDQPVSN
jgi:hypothetical protein